MEPSSGILSSVFSFVSREIESFVTNATGGEIPPRNIPDKTRRKRKKRLHEPYERRVLRHVSPSDQEEVHPPTSASPTPIPVPKPRHATPPAKGITMPGSLYPRSPSREPSARNAEAGPSQPRRARTPVPLRQPAVPSVREAVRRFDTSDDSTLLLPISPIRKGKEKAIEKSDESMVRGKERELSEARERVRDADSIEDGKADKARIRALEAEIARLKYELSKRPDTPTDHSTSHPASYPPPPPPPPVPPRPSMQLTRAATLPFSSVRAALKPVTPPIEMPINNVAAMSRTRRTGQPTINVSSEKLAAFLSEMKNVRLRKVSVERPTETSRGLKRSWAGDVSHRPEKRRAIDTSDRRTSLPHTASLMSTSTQSAESPSTSQTHASNRTWPSITTNTPSLCSDHEGEGEGDDHAPSTPPVPIRVYDPKGKQRAEEPRYLTPSTDKVKLAHRNRAPVSPMPAQPTPKKPRAPARSKKRREELDTDADPLNITGRPAVSKVKTKSGIPRRKSTLDDELRVAFAKGQSRLDNSIDLDSEILVGVGSRSKKRGFLTGGGAGGAPVFLGEGYVDGVELNDDELQ